jgi:hypothetical protein
MQIAKDIWKGAFNYVSYKLGLTFPEWNKIYDQHRSACDKCPLKKGVFCSKRKSVQIIDNQKLLIKNPTGVVSGCGCIIPLKAATTSPCPLNKWQSFDI